MNALTAVKPTPAPVAQQYRIFFHLPPSRRACWSSPFPPKRPQFLQQVAQWPVQALEYKSFLRFGRQDLDDLWQSAAAVADQNIARSRGRRCLSTAKDRSRQPAEEMVKLATAVAHLIGRSTSTP